MTDANRAHLVWEQTSTGVYQTAFCPLRAGQWIVTLEMPHEEPAYSPFAVCP